MISGVSDSSTATPQSTGNVSDRLTTNKDQFIKLLVAQLKNQDPLNTSDPDKFTQQLTQFSQLEQLYNINDSFKGLKDQQHSMDKSQAVSFIGKTVDVPGNKMFISPDQPAKVGFHLDAPADNISIDVVNGSNQIVRSMDVSNVDSGSTFLDFDKKDRFGNALPQGNYTYRVRSIDGSGNTTNVQPMVRGIVNQVDFSGDSILVKVNGLNIPASEVTAVYAA
ncbi:MAG: hypothetical protein IPJ69_03020 [Deltaproteobacteria bacterium]|nr:MAG: hypothetical protein IPJ69_03020 [Deltaproteobacteria bacterium]